MLLQGLQKVQSTRGNCDDQNIDVNGLHPVPFSARLVFLLIYADVAVLECK